MKKYLNLFVLFSKNGLMGEMEFRGNFFMWIISNIIWLISSLLFINFFFDHASSIAGWTRSEVLILVTIFNIFIGMMWSFILLNISDFHHHIRNGTLDFALIKPVNVRFWVSTRISEFDQYPRVLVSIITLVYFLQKYGYHVTTVQIGCFALTMILCLIIFYNLFFTITTTNFWLINLFNLENLFDSINGMATYPVQVFSSYIRTFFSYVVPIAFVATFPAEILLGRDPVPIVLSAMLIVLATSLISQWFWNFALKRYSSASS